MRVHHFLHVEHYWPNAAADDMYLLRAYNYTLRQAVMCQGDTSLITFRRSDRQPIPLGDSSSGHRCKSWEGLDEWNKERFIDVFQPGLVVHPRFGPAYSGVSTSHNTGVIIEEGKVENGQCKLGTRESRHKDSEDAATEATEATEAKGKRELAWSRGRKKAH